jgi:hypothetical protein
MGFKNAHSFTYPILVEAKTGKWMIGRPIKENDGLGNCERLSKNAHHWC